MSSYNSRPKKKTKGGVIANSNANFTNVQPSQSEISEADLAQLHTTGLEANLVDFLHESAEGYSSLGVLVDQHLAECNYIGRHDNISAELLFADMSIDSRLLMNAALSSFRSICSGPGSSISSKSILHRDNIDAIRSFETIGQATIAGISSVTSHPSIEPPAAHLVQISDVFKANYAHHVKDRSGVVTEFLANIQAVEHIEETSHLLLLKLQKLSTFLRNLKDATKGGNVLDTDFTAAVPRIFEKLNSRSLQGNFGDFLPYLLLLVQDPAFQRQHEILVPKLDTWSNSVRTHGRLAVPFDMYFAFLMRLLRYAEIHDSLIEIINSLLDPHSASLRDRMDILTPLAESISMISEAATFFDLDIRDFFIPDHQVSYDRSSLLFGVKSYLALQHWWVHDTNSYASLPLPLPDFPDVPTNVLQTLKPVVETRDPKDFAGSLMHFHEHFHIIIDSLTMVPETQVRLVALLLPSYFAFGREVLRESVTTTPFASGYAGTFGPQHSATLLRVRQRLEDYNQDPIFRITVQQHLVHTVVDTFYHSTTKDAAHRFSQAAALLGYVPLRLRDVLQAFFSNVRDNAFQHPSPFYALFSFEGVYSCDKSIFIMTLFGKLLQLGPNIFRPDDLYAYELATAPTIACQLGVFTGLQINVSLLHVFRPLLRQRAGFSPILMESYYSEVVRSPIGSFLLNGRLTRFAEVHGMRPYSSATLRAMHQQLLAFNATNPPVEGPLAQLQAIDQQHNILVPDMTLLWADEPVKELFADTIIARGEETSDQFTTFLDRDIDRNGIRDPEIVVTHSRQGTIGPTEEIYSKNEDDEEEQDQGATDSNNESVPELWEGKESDKGKDRGGKSKKDTDSEEESIPSLQTVSSNSSTVTDKPSQAPVPIVVRTSDTGVQLLHSMWVPAQAENKDEDSSDSEDDEDVSEDKNQEDNEDLGGDNEDEDESDGDEESDDEDDDDEDMPSKRRKGDDQTSEKRARRDDDSDDEDAHKKVLVTAEQQAKAKKTMQKAEQLPASDVNHSGSKTGKTTTKSGGHELGEDRSSEAFTDLTSVYTGNRKLEEPKGGFLKTMKARARVPHISQPSAMGSSSDSENSEDITTKVSIAYYMDGTNYIPYQAVVATTINETGTTTYERSISLAGQLVMGEGKSLITDQVLLDEFVVTGQATFQADFVQMMRETDNLRRHTIDDVPTQVHAGFLRRYQGATEIEVVTLWLAYIDVYLHHEQEYQNLFEGLGVLIDEPQLCCKIISALPLVPVTQRDILHMQHTASLGLSLMSHMVDRYGVRWKGNPTTYNTRHCFHGTSKAPNFTCREFQALTPYIAYPHNAMHWRYATLVMVDLVPVYLHVIGYNIDARVLAFINPYDENKVYRDFQVNDTIIFPASHTAIIYDADELTVLVSRATLEVLPKGTVVVKRGRKLNFPKYYKLYSNERESSATRISRWVDEFHYRIFISFIRSDWRNTLTLESELACARYHLRLESIVFYFASWLAYKRKVSRRLRVKRINPVWVRLRTGFGWIQVERYVVPLPRAPITVHWVADKHFASILFKLARTQFMSLPRDGEGDSEFSSENDDISRDNKHIEVDRVIVVESDLSD